VIAHVAVYGRRACAVLAASSALLHGISLIHATSPAAAVLTVAMVAGCLYCARDLWVGGALRAWVLVALMNLAMIALHAPASATHHHGGGVNADAPVHHSTVMPLATTLAAVEVIAAAAVLYHRTRAIRPASLSVDGPVLRERDVPRGPHVGVTPRGALIHPAIRTSSTASFDKSASWLAEDGGSSRSMEA
jgi:hypothetical protein